MMHEDILENFRTYVPFTKEEVKDFFGKGKYVKYRKNEVLVEKGDPVSPFIFIRKGCLMTYYSDSKNFNHVIQFGLDKWWTGDLQSFMQGTPSSYTIKAMSDTEVWTLDKNAFESLCAEHPSFERYFRILFQNSLISHQKRIIRNISFSAEEKYLTFVKNFPKLELLIAQKYIASYLGITPEFLSMIRRKLANKA
ncbi:Crp/Fnr family transcriptional regulator [Cecembia rubra]|nr:Crp/Fnr family transcriptional regulator [Cecembia rubra]